MGLDERLIRASVFWLVRDGWLVRKKMEGEVFTFYHPRGKYGKKEYQRAARRIYRVLAPSWDGLWTLLIPVFVPDAQKERLKRVYSDRGSVCSPLVFMSILAQSRNPWKKR